MWSLRRRRSIPTLTRAAGDTVNNPLADGPVGEYPDLPPRSGVDVVLDACDRATSHTSNLQNFVNDLRAFIEGKHVVGAVEIRNLLESHHV